MSRSRTPFISGTITDNPLTNVATTINSAGLSSLPAIATPDIAVLVLDPTGSAGAPEVVYVTAHTGSATSATISRGQEGSSGRQHASGVSWVHGPTTYDLKGWRLEGSNTAEQTTVSLTAVDLVTISGLLIGPTQYVEISGIYRKSAGAASGVGIGLKLNTTVISEAVVGSGLVYATAGADEAASGHFKICFGPRSTTYLKGIYSIFGNSESTGTNARVGPGNQPTVDLVTATITSVILRGISGSASVTLGVKDVQVMVRDA